MGTLNKLMELKQPSKDIGRLLQVLFKKRGLVLVSILPVKSRLYLDHPTSLVDVGSVSIEDNKLIIELGPFSALALPVLKRIASHEKPINVVSVTYNTKLVKAIPVVRVAMFYDISSLNRVRLSQAVAQVADLLRLKASPCYSNNTCPDLDTMSKMWLQIISQRHAADWNRVPCVNTFVDYEKRSIEGRTVYYRVNLASEKCSVPFVAIEEILFLDAFVIYVKLGSKKYLKSFSDFAKKLGYDIEEHPNNVVAITLTRYDRGSIKELHEDVFLGYLDSLSRKRGKL